MELHSPTEIKPFQFDEDLQDSGLGPGRIRKYASQDPATQEWRNHDKHVFVLSSAGKPIYSRYGDENLLVNLMGVMQVIISTFSEQDDSVRSIQSDQLTMVFLMKDPLFYVVVSKQGEPEASLRDQLQWLHNQILSITSQQQLQKIFEQHSNYDLRRLLGGTEPFLDHLCRNVTTPPYVFSAIQSLRMQSSLRQQVGQCLLQAVKSQQSQTSLLYGMLIVGSRLVTILRPKNHSFHPQDLHLILNMVNSSTSFKSSPESWLPICLPKYNDKSFLHAYISYITPNYPGPSKDLCLVLVSQTGADFHSMSAVKTQVVKELTQGGALFLLQDAIRRCEFGIEELQVPGIQHFIYKSRPNIQYTMPVLHREELRFFQTYQRIRYTMHDKFMPEKIHFEINGGESVYGWITAQVELIVIFQGVVTKSHASAAMNAVLKWVKAQESSLFIVNAPTL